MIIKIVYKEELEDVILLKKQSVKKLIFVLIFRKI
jgi:hypothetical protein